MINRRGLLALLGGAAAMPTAGAKTAAAAMGVPLSPIESFPVEGMRAQSSIGSGWWGSGVQIASEARWRAREQREQERYAHMKSWGPAFRHSVIQREIHAEMAFQRKMESDETFAAKVLSAFLEAP